MPNFENNTIKKNKVDIALIVFTIVFGLILLGNLFEVLPWEIWRQGGVVVGIVFAVNILYKILRKKPWAFHLSQFLILTLTFMLVAHTILALTKPNYLEIQKNEFTDHEYYYQTMELKTSRYEGIASKSIKAYIDKSHYIVLDSIEDSYYFKIHPPKQSNTDASIAYAKEDSHLAIDFQSANYQLSSVQKILDLRPTLIFGTPHIPLSIDLKLENFGSVDVNLQNQKIDDFMGLFASGKSNIKFSVKSIPRSKFLVTIRGGILEISLPKELEHIIKYTVRNNAKFFVGNKQVIGQGEYKIISTGEKNTCEIKIDLDFGELKINVH